MSRLLDPTLPPPLLARLGREAHDPTLVVPVLTNDEAGFPHVALLSTWELIAVDPVTVRLALWTDSGSVANLRRTGKATLLVADEAVAFYVKLRLTHRQDGMRAASWNAVFEGRVETVLADYTDADVEGGSRLASGLRFTPDPDHDETRRAVRLELANLPPAP